MRSRGALAAVVCALGACALPGAEESADEEQRPAIVLTGIWNQQRVAGRTGDHALLFSGCRFLLVGRTCSFDSSGQPRQDWSGRTDCADDGAEGTYVLDPSTGAVRFTLLESGMAPASGRIESIGAVHFIDADTMELFPRRPADSRRMSDVLDSLLGPWTRAMVRPGRPESPPQALLDDPADPAACLEAARARHCAEQASAQRVDCDGLPENGCESVSWEQNRTCASAFPLGTVRGDAEHDTIGLEGLGGAVFGLNVTETVSEYGFGPGTPVRARLELASPSGRYRFEVLEGGCASAPSGPPVSEASLSWSDDGMGDDSRALFIRVVDLAPGPACEGWTLSVRGNE